MAERDSKGRFIKAASVPAEAPNVSAIVKSYEQSVDRTNEALASSLVPLRERMVHAPLYTPESGYVPLVRMPLNAQQALRKTKNRAAAKRAKQSRKVNR